MHVRCPHCHNPIELVDETPLGEITCPSCHSSFSLIVEETVSAGPLTARRLGRFELVSPLGTGGFGTVWMARDTELDRTVAVKVPRKEQLAKEEVEQFLREARAAAQVKHPNIVAVHEVGREGDTVYIVSDYIRGVPLSSWLSGRGLTMRESVELTATIADALHHAHERGIVHRDLKPGNIMMETRDIAQGRQGGNEESDASSASSSSLKSQASSLTLSLIPHITDFGLAKRDAGEITMTIEGRVLGTPAYMSPEQARGEGHHADRRTDIYSLGVILFQLLTGELPFRGDKQMLIYQVVHEEPASPRRLKSTIPRDLETITLKCLQKNSAKRYATAADLAADLCRWLAHEPIHARPISRVERIGRWCRRKPAIAGMGTAIVVVAVLGFAGVTWQWRQAAAREAETAAVLDFVENKVFAAARPIGKSGGLGPEVTLRKAIESALPFVESSFHDQPLIEARLRMMMGTSFWHLTEAKAAAEQYERARTLYMEHRGPDHADTLKATNDLANSYGELGRYAEADALHRKTLELRKAKLGPDDPDTLTSMSNLAANYIELGEYGKAAELNQETLELRKAKLGDDDPDTLASMSNLAACYTYLDRHADALELRQKLLPIQTAKLGPNHAETLSSMNNLAVSYSKLGRHSEALDLRERILPLQKEVLGPDHADTLMSMNNLAVSYSRVGQLDKARELFEKTFAMRKSKHGHDHPRTLDSMHNLADCYSNLGRHADALKLHTEAFGLRKDKCGRNHPDTLESMGHMAECLVKVDRGAEAVAIIDECLRLAGGKVVDQRLVPMVLDARMRHFEKIKDAAGCRATTAMWEKVKRTDADSLYLAACFRAVTAAVIRATDKSDAAILEAAGQADQAVDWLRQAVAAGYKDARQMAEDKDLDALRGRADFKKLLADLTTKTSQ